LRVDATVDYGHCRGKAASTPGCPVDTVSERDPPRLDLTKHSFVQLVAAFLLTVRLGSNPAIHGAGTKRVILSTSSGRSLGSTLWQAIDMAEAYSKAGYHKQIVNGFLELFSYITVVVTGTQWSNFLTLGDHPDAEPHIQILAKRVREALDSAKVQTLEPGQWHLPFGSLAQTLPASSTRHC
jgi:hypothetical protein